jgi:hypothetical protein
MSVDESAQTQHGQCRPVSGDSLVSHSQNQRHIDRATKNKRGTQLCLCCTRRVWKDAGCIVSRRTVFALNLLIAVE